jgi:hypothetical protein
MKDRRAVGGCPGGAEQGRIANEDDRSGGRVDLLAVDREDRVSGHHGEELLVAVRLVLLVVGLVMRFDHLVAGVSGRGVDTERLDVEMATEEMKLAVVDVLVPGVDLFQGVTSARRTEPYGAVRGSLVAPMLPLPRRAGLVVEVYRTRRRDALYRRCPPKPAKLAHRRHAPCAHARRTDLATTLIDRLGERFAISDGCTRSTFRYAASTAPSRPLR